MNPSSFFKLKFTWKTAPLYLILLTISLIYESLVLARLSLYRKGVLRPKKVKIPIISVGNLTVGGAGKTPMVDFLVKELIQQNKTCGVLSRGYRSQNQMSLQRVLMTDAIPTSPEKLGDEPYILASKNPTVPIYVGKNRTFGAVLAQLLDNPQVLILDDGYQHLQLHRTLNLLLIDAERGLGNGHLLPLGALREPVHHWQRADAIILTKSNLGFSDRVLHQLQKDLKVKCPIFQFQYNPLGIRRLDQKQFIASQELAQKRVLLSCGIAQPKGFVLSLQHLDAEILHVQTFADHFVYTKPNVTSLLQQQQRWQPDLWITTEKDAVKLESFSELLEVVWVLEMQVIPDPEWQEFFIDFLGQNGLK